jgi:[NiFe] hydrogenase assembly HybE family chaperone
MPDAVDRLVSAYCSIEQQHMRGLPICNPALQVEAVGFRPHGEHLCGVLITPWFINLVMLSATGEGWPASTTGSKVTCRFPAGDYEFTLGMPEGIEAHLSTPLFSTVQDFPDHDAARKVAEEVLALLYESGNQTAGTDPMASEREKSGFNRPVSRRGLLRGWLSASRE